MRRWTVYSRYVGMGSITVLYSGIASRLCDALTILGWLSNLMTNQLAASIV
jgi:hypothetical protein